MIQVQLIWAIQTWTLPTIFFSIFNLVHLIFNVLMEWFSCNFGFTLQCFPPCVDPLGLVAKTRDKVTFILIFPF